MSEIYSSYNFFERKITLENITLTFTGEEESSTNGSPQNLPPLQHFHAHGELFYCVSGELIIYHKDQSQTITKGDIAFIPPNVFHYTKRGSDTKTYVLGITMKKHVVKDSFDAYYLVSSLFNAEAPLSFRRNFPINPENMNWIFKISTSDHLIYTLSGAQTLIAISKSYHDQLLTVDYNINNNSKNANTIMLLETFINGHYYEHFTAEDLAAMLYISPRQLARIVKERYHTSLHRVIIKKRLDSAAYLLRNTAYPVEFIISHVGFNTKMSFYNAFKKEYKMTPSQYRAKEKTI